MRLDCNIMKSQDNGKMIPLVLPFEPSGILFDPSSSTIATLEALELKAIVAPGTYRINPLQILHRPLHVRPVIHTRGESHQDQQVTTRALNLDLFPCGLR